MEISVAPGSRSSRVAPTLIPKRREFSRRGLHYEARILTDGAYPEQASAIASVAELKADLHMRCIVSELVSRVEDAQIVDILDITLPEVHSQGVLFCEEMKRVEGFCLCFSDWRDICRTCKTLKTS